MRYMARSPNGMVLVPKQGENAVIKLEPDFHAVLALEVGTAALDLAATTMLPHVMADSRLGVS